MSNLFFSTLVMMGITFIIGFFVAGIIKIIANWADFFDFYHLHKEEIVNMKREHRLHHHVALAEAATAEQGNTYTKEHQSLAHKIKETVDGLKPRKRVTA